MLSKGQVGTLAARVRSSSARSATRRLSSLSVTSHTTTRTQPSLPNCVTKRGSKRIQVRPFSTSRVVRSSDPESLVETKAADDEGEVDEAMAVDVPPLAVGDLVEIRRGNRGEMGILIKMSGGECTSVLFNGHIIIHREPEVCFQVAGWAYSPAVTKNPISAAAVSSATIGLSPDSQAALKAANIPPSTLAHIVRFQEAATKYAYEKRDKLSSAWANFEVRGTKILTVDGLARWAFYDPQPDDSPLITPTNAELYASYNHLARQTDQFRPLRPNRIRETREFYVRPAAEVQKIKWLWSQVRAGNSARSSSSQPAQPSAFSSDLTAFLDKSKTLITWYRATNGIPTPDKPVPSVTFTSIDRLFISALISAAVENVGTFFSPYKNIAFAIMRALYPLYNSRGGDMDVQVMIKEIGVWRSWENVGMLKASPKGRLEHLEGHGMAEWADAVWEEAKVAGGVMLDLGVFEYDEAGGLVVRKMEGELNPLKGGTIDEKVLDLVKSKVEVPTSPYLPDFYTQDPCASIRRDFGNTPVYVIDDPNAHELDDGISIEETPNGTWMHIHIADPTAYIPPNNPTSLIAQLRGNSVYLPERHYPMMPEQLSKMRFDLGVSQCAMTFSAKIGEDGEIVDYNVSPSIIRNAKIIHYDDVDDVLDWSNVYGIDRAEGGRAKWVGDTFQARGVKGAGIHNDTANKIDEEAAKTLRTLQGLARRHYEARLRRGGFLSDQPDYSVRLRPYPLDFLPAKSERLVYEGAVKAPTITVNPYKAGHLSPAHLFVSEAMVVGGRVAAKFCSDRKVPAAYRTQMQVRDNGLDAQSLNILDEVMKRRDERSGVIPYEEFRRLLRFMPGAKVTTKPGPHSSMGIPGPRDEVNGATESEVCGYVKVTSPLRRYKDMVVHWNIKANLLGQPYPFEEGA
ncbi:hypothetical protein HK097_003553, partial [Rhizophlyctis rosea]